MHSTTTKLSQLPQLANGIALQPNNTVHSDNQSDNQSGNKSGCQRDRLNKQPPRNKQPSSIKLPSPQRGATRGPFRFSQLFDSFISDSALGSLLPLDCSLGDIECQSCLSATST